MFYRSIPIHARLSPVSELVICTPCLFEVFLHPFKEAGFFLGIAGLESGHRLHLLQKILFFLVQVRRNDNIHADNQIPFGHTALYRREPLVIRALPPKVGTSTVVPNAASI